MRHTDVESRLADRFGHAARVGALLVATLGLVVLAGWAFDLTALKTVLPGLPSMKANTAVLFVLAGAALWRNSRPPASPGVRVAAVVISVVAGATLAQYLFSINLGIDQLLVRDSTSLAGAPPGRMAPATALIFLSLSLGLLVIDSRLTIWTAQSLAGVAALIAFIALCGYLYDATSLQSIGSFVSIALHTAAGGLVASFALIASRPREGVMAIVISDTSAGALLRLLLPSLVLLIMGAGWIRLEGQEAGLYDTVVGVALLVAANVVIVTSAAWLFARSLHRSELRRQRSQAQAAAHEIELQRYAERDRLFHLSIDMVCIANAAGRFLQISPSFEQVLGYTSDELLAGLFLDFVHPDDYERTRLEAQVAAQRPTLAFVNRYRRKDGEYRWFQWKAAPDGSGLIYAIARDITDDIAAAETMKQSRESLARALAEREVLLKEIHHRVKNNLQVISSLIQLQSRRLPEGHSRRALEDCQHRVLAIALIHEQLYGSADYANVPFPDYVRDLANSIRAAGMAPDTVSMEFEIADVPLTVDQAIPCGLMLNELISNALKHAYPDGRPGRIIVTMGPAAPGEIALSVRDDGIGMPVLPGPNDANTLGLQLVRTLAGQLGGRLEIETTAGTSFTITFPGEASA